ncbi:galactose-1-epimerase [Sporanaerobium hydrogeniformans]|uniref:Galactose-1-epimerase n=1 Tax=Sporanaerobium hydrogeniformans TaxID=3072179 RepID=A0AC61DDK7_9FIRM|nr:galactose-1-epimerase [Sporanaerobium hydrogeniformans]
MVLKSGKEIKKFQLMNDQGMVVELINLGATLTQVLVPDQEGKLENVVLSWQDKSVYEENPGCFGSIIGRVAGRIGEAKVTLGDKVYEFAKNSNGKNTIHGGEVAYHTQLWEGKGTSDAEEATVSFTYWSRDGEAGFPGNLDIKVDYVLKNDNSLTIDYTATTDKETIINLTNHTYFNLSGDAKRPILEQEVVIHSDTYCELDSELIPTGKLIALNEDSIFDFRKAKAIGRDINEKHEQLVNGAGYDHPWVLNDDEVAVEFYDKVSKRYMEVTTTAPGVVMYTMNHADAPLLLENGESQKPRYGVCFETQCLPIGRNELFKEGVILKPEDTYRQKTVFKFGIR